jgi:2-amino-4-hydroxy-6-hydroxymethyldihydropteridine diphosphokinase
MMNRVFISMGSNIDGERNLREATRRLALRCRLLAVSPVYETAPVGGADEVGRANQVGKADNFLNAAALIETDLAVAELKMNVLQVIEQELGRVRTEDKNGPRTIDLDISLFNDQVFDVGQRHIPDPEIGKYPHIAVPLADLAPDQPHPETGQTLGLIAQNMPAGDLVRRTDIVLWPESSVSTKKGEQNG